MQSAKRFWVMFTLAAAALGGCTTEAAGGGDGKGDPKDKDKDGEDVASCDPSDATVVLSATILGYATVDFAGEQLGFGYIDEDGAPTVQIHDVTAAETVTAQWSKKVVSEHYGSSYIRTSLAHNGDTFGFGWYTEADRIKEKDTWTTRFGTVAADSGETTSVADGNDDYGRAGSEDMVQARNPHVMPFGEGFLMTWDDVRTAEPTELNVNVAGWKGIYGRRYDAKGKAAANDVQIAQAGSPASITGVSDGTRVMPIWSVEDGKYHSRLYARSESVFTPVKVKPLEELDSYRTTQLAAALGPDGDVLVVVERWTGYSGPTTLGSMLLSMSGTVKESYADWDDAPLRSPALVATKDGYVVAGYEMAKEDTPDALATAVRILWLDAAGQRLSEEHVELSLAEGTHVGKLALRVQGATVQVAFTTEAAQYYNQPFDAEVHVATVCAAP